MILKNDLLSSRLREMARKAAQEISAGLIEGKLEAKDCWELMEAYIFEALREV
jgi:hypothetical protein